jgi:hypothetical protein
MPVLESPMSRALLSLLLLVSLAAGCADDPGESAGDDDTSDPGGDSVDWFCVPDDGEVSALDDDGWLVETEHYALHAWVAEEDARELARMLEAAWQAEADYFDAIPDLAAGETLVVKMFADQAGFEDGLIADGVQPPAGAGGYYWPPNRTAYLYAQPTRYFTHALTIHEAAHQFHALARTGNEGRPSWYVEGVAEYLAHHHWDGECVALGILPQVTLEDYAQQALDGIDGFDIEGVVGGWLAASRPLGWALYRYLEHGEGGALARDFATFREEMDAGLDDSLGRFEELFGPASALGPEIEAFVQGDQEPLEYVFLEWTHVAPGVLDGEAHGALSFTPVKGAHEGFEAAFELPAGAEGHGGVVVAWDDGDDYAVLLIRADGELSTFVNEGGAISWDWLAELPPPADGLFEVEVDVSREPTLVLISGEEVEVDVPGSPAAGLAVYDASIRYRDVAWW